MNTSIILLNLVVLAVSLESDLGRRKIGPFRVFRPPVTALAIIPFFFHGMAWSGNGLLLEIAAVVIGAGLGLAALAFMKFEYDPVQRRTFSRAGFAYALAWLGITGAKVFFSYGSSDLWARPMFTWLFAHGIGVDAFRAAFIFLNVSMVLARVAVIYVRGSATAKAAGSAKLFRVRSSVAA